MAIISAKDVAQRIGVEPKTFRRFVREYHRAKGLGDNLPGRGGRYAFDDENVESIERAFNAWRMRSSTSFVIFSEDDDVTSPEDDA